MLAPTLEILNRQDRQQLDAERQSQQLDRTMELQSLSELKQAASDSLPMLDLEFKIVQRLATDPRTSNIVADVTVNTIDRTVFLGGQAPTMEAAQTVERIAAGVSGVGEVCNHLRIGPSRNAYLYN